MTEKDPRTDGDPGKQPDEFEERDEFERDEFEERDDFASRNVFMPVAGQGTGVPHPGSLVGSPSEVGLPVADETGDAGTQPESEPSAEDRPHRR